MEEITELLLEFKEKHGRFPLLGTENLNSNGTRKNIFIWTH